MIGIMALLTLAVAGDAMPPRLTGMVPAAYPPEAFRLHQEGRVAARLQVSRRGVVTKCEVITSSGSPALDAATCQAMRQWRYIPAKDVTGAPVDASLDASLTWRLPAG